MTTISTSLQRIAAPPAEAPRAVHRLRAIGRWLATLGQAFRRQPGRSRQQQASLPCYYVE